MSASESDTPELRKPTLWECFATAVHFLTRVTISKRLAACVDVDHAMALNRAVVFFPFVGGLIGIFTGGVLVGLCSLGVPGLLAALLAIGVEAYFTGAFHEDAFADVCDALGGGWTREQVLEIMKDSRLGTYGTIGLVVGVGARAVAMASIASSDLFCAFATIVAAAMIGRLAIVLFMVTTEPIASRHSQARDVSGTQSGQRVLIAILLASPFGVAWAVALQWVAAFSLLACLIVLSWFRRLVLRRINGTTGDTLGASGFLTQLVVLTGATIT